MKILVAYDGSACADAAVVDMRRAGIPRDAEVLVISIVDSALPHASRTDQYEGHALTDTVHKWIQTNFPEWKESRQVLVGSPTAVILEKVVSWDPDLLIVGTHGRSLARRVLLGSVSQKLAQEAPCSIRLVRAEPTPPARGPIRILVGSDGSNEAAVVIQKVAQRFWPKDSEVRIVSVLESIVPVISALEANAYVSGPALSLTGESDEHHRERLMETSREFLEWLQRAGLIVSSAVVEGDPKHVLVAEADRWKADVIFVGARGIGRMEQVLLGSVSNFVLKQAHCAVEIVRGKKGDRP